MAGTSRIDFTPAETTVTRVLLSTSRSADSSNDSAKPRCTPPRPAGREDPDAGPGRKPRCRRDGRGAAGAPSARATGRSRRPSLRSAGLQRRVRARPGSRPMQAMPSSTAMVAGQAPACRGDGLELVCNLEVARPGETVGDNRRLRATTGCRAHAQPPGRGGGPGRRRFHVVTHRSPRSFGAS